MKNLELQIGQLATIKNNQQKGKFPSNIDVSLQKHYNAITLRSRKKIEEIRPKEALVLTPTSNHIEEKLVEKQKTEAKIIEKASKPNLISFSNNLPILKLASPYP